MADGEEAKTARDELQQFRQMLGTLSIEALVQSAVDSVIAEEQDADDIRPNFAVSELQSRATPETLSAMTALLFSSNPYERDVAAWVMGQMRSDAGDYHAFQDEAVDALLQGLAYWQDEPRTLESIGIALGHRNDPRAVPALVALKGHPDSRVRYGVVIGLWGLTAPLAVATLLDLTTDADEKVRDWATSVFTFLEVDSPEIHEAMFARTFDADIDIRSEAIEALAVRGDQRALPALLQAIADGANGSPILDAAIKLADPQLYPALITLRGNVNSWDEKTLEKAIAACTPKKSDSS